MKHTFGACCISAAISGMAGWHAHPNVGWMAVMLVLLVVGAIVLEMQQ